MKHLNNILSLFFLVALLPLNSCDDGTKAYLKDYNKILYLRNSGLIESTFYNTGEDDQYHFVVTKAGYDENATASVSLELMSASDLRVYNAENGTQYKILPQNSFSLEGGQLNFQGADKYKTVAITLKPEIIEQETAGSKDTYVIPVRLSSSTDSINTNKQFAFLHPVIRKPFIAFEDAGAQAVSMADDGKEMETVENSVMIPTNNKWRLSVALWIDNDAAQAYNQKHGTSYRPLPPELYEYPKAVKIADGERKEKFAININKKQLEYGRYILPVALGEVSHPSFIPAADKNQWLLILSYIPPTIPLTADMLSSNAKEPSEGSFAGLLDNNVNTYFHSAWSVAIPEDHYLQVALKEPISTFVFKYTNRENSPNGSSVDFTVSVSADGKQFTDIRRFTREQDNITIERAKSWESPAISTAEPILYIRFTNHKNFVNDKFFVWSEFSLSGK